MNQIYLIDKATFQLYEDISINIKPERIKIFVKKTQDLDLRPFLGHTLYYDFIKNFDSDGVINDNAPQYYKDLFNGAEYLDDKGNIVLYEGLIPMLVYFTFARFIENDAVHYTSTGPVIKNHDFGCALDYRDTVKLVQQQRSIANAYANDAERFLIDHQENFPLWHYNHKNKSSRQPGPRIRAVDKTDFNYTSGLIDQIAYLPITEFLN